jgi:signal transduction histidine kinase
MVRAAAIRPHISDDDLGTITVSTFADHEAAPITATDTGGGIPEEIREKILEHFFTTKDVARARDRGWP